jgi:hypothetical protein
MGMLDGLVQVLKRKEENVKSMREGGPRLQLSRRVLD